MRRRNEMGFVSMFVRPHVTSSSSSSSAAAAGAEEDLLTFRERSAEDSFASYLMAWEMSAKTGSQASR